MSLRRRYAAGAVLLGALAFRGAPVEAQAPNIMAPKNAAHRAALAANAHTEAMQRDPAAPTPIVVGSATSALTYASVAPAAGSQPGGVTPPVPAPRAGATASGSSAAAAGPARSGSAASRAADAAVPATTIAPGERARQLSLMREAFTYEHDSRRDPFLSLLSTGELRPMISDLRLAAIIYDPAGRSVAILRDLSTKEQYRIKVGQAVGRMRVAQINTKTVTFTLEEFGYSRQEVLALPDPIKK